MIATQKDGVFYVGDDALIPVDELSDFVGEKAIFHHVYEGVRRCAVVHTLSGYFSI